MRLESVSEVYSQPEDCCGRVEVSVQDLEISTQDGGGGSYIVIKTERWALEDAKEIDVLAAKLKAILKRIPKEAT